MMQSHNSKINSATYLSWKAQHLTWQPNNSNNEMIKTMDKIDPATTKAITSRHKKPWYDEDLKNQRRIMKNRERKWIKYRDDQHWKAFKRE